MPDRSRLPARLAPAACLLGITLAAVSLSFCNLGRMPPYLGGDEAHFGVQAASIASSGRDLGGHVLPLLFNLTDPLGDRLVSVRWYQPLMFYLTALVLAVAPLTEASVRAPAACIAVADALLIYFVAWRLFRRRGIAVIAALLIVTTPAHLILSRQATDYVCPLPLLLAWLWCLIASLESGGAWPAAAGGAMLGLGCYSYLAAWIWMPAFMLLTAATYMRAGDGSRRDRALQAAAAALGFAVCAAPLAAWLWSHPEMLRQTSGRYKLPAAPAASVLATATAWLRLRTLADMVSIYWDYFNPAFLFMTGGASLTTSTGRAGVFLLPMAIFLPLGLCDLVLRRGARPIGGVLLAGLALAPLPATLAGERDMIQRELIVLPLAVLVSTYGIAFMWQRPRRSRRLAVVLLLAAAAIQFTFVSRDYFGAYQFRAAAYFDPNDFRDLAASVIGADTASPVPAVYISRRLDDASARWRFYTTKAHRTDLLQRTRYFDGDGLDLGAAAAGSLAMFDAGPEQLAPLLADRSWTVAAMVLQPSNGFTSVVLRRNEDVRK